MTPEQIEAAMRAICDQHKLTYLEASFVAGSFDWVARGVNDRTHSGRSLPHVLDQMHAARQAREMAADLNLRAD